MKNMYVIYDSIAKEGGDILIAKSDDIAIRQVVNLVREHKYMNPSEYKLYRVGSYNPELVELSLLQFNIEIDFMPFVQKAFDEADSRARKMFTSAIGKDIKEKFQGTVVSDVK